MAKAKSLIKGNYAIAEAAVRAGCTFFAGYPITPQSEVLEYMSWRLPQAGGTFVQTESEIAGISMVFGAASCGVRAMTSSSGPGFDLMQEGISYMSSSEIPAVIVDLTRYGSGLGAISPSQGDYWQLTRNGGHGDYRCIVLAPGNLQEAVDYMRVSFELAEKYRNPVIVACDGSIGQMIEAVDFPDPITVDPAKQTWAIQEKHQAERREMRPPFYYRMSLPTYDKYIREKFETIEANETRYESFMTEDADVILVAYGTTSRICKEAVLKARKKDLKLGLIRPITLWPFPKEAFKEVKPKAFLSVEMCAIPQMIEDVVIAARGIAPSYAFATGSVYPEEEDVIGEALKVLAGKATEV